MLYERSRWKHGYGLPAAFNPGPTRIFLIFYFVVFWRGKFILGKYFPIFFFVNINWSCLSFMPFGGHSVEKALAKFRNNEIISRAIDEI